MFFFFPVRDEYGVKRFPIIVFLIIAVNCLVYFIFGFRPVYKEIVQAYGFIPSVFSWKTLITSMFLHGSIFHLGFNMWYLWLTGDNLEDRWGRMQFLLFYLAAGLFAGILYTVMIPEKSNTIPTIGASGAIAGVLGAYAFLFPKSRITFKYFIFIFFIFRAGEFELYSSVWLGLWFFQQLVYTLLVKHGSAASSVAFAAHFAGFVFGFIIASGTKLFQSARHQANIAEGENALLNLLGSRPFVIRNLDEQGAIDRLRNTILANIEENRLAATAAYEETLAKYSEVTMPEKIQYRLAESFENQGKKSEALLTYRNFILSYPTSKLADNALFALGKLFLDMGDWEKARNAFLQIVIFYPYSDVYEEAKFYLDRKLPEIMNQQSQI